MNYVDQINALDLTQPSPETAEEVLINAPFAHIAEMHFDEVTNLFTVWRSAVLQPQYDQASLAELENRISSHIAGMRLQENVTWQHSVDVLPHADIGEVFAATQLAFRSYDLQKIKTVVTSVEATSHEYQGVIFGLAWLPEDISNPWITKFLASKNVWHKYLAVEACRIRGINLGDKLLDLLTNQACHDCPPLLISLLRSLAEFKHLNALPYLQKLDFKNDSEFWYFYSRILLGERGLVVELKRFLMNPDLEIRRCASNLSFRLLSIERAQQWISDLVKDGCTMEAIAAVRHLGDPQAVPWLIGLMRNPLYSRVAGQGFYQITGCDLIENSLQLDSSPIPLEKELEYEAADMENAIFQQMLPWPNTDAIWSLWQCSMSPSFLPGYRYLLGQKVCKKVCLTVLESGHQEEREHAAYELALINPSERLYNTRGLAHPEA